MKNGNHHNNDNWIIIYQYFRVFRQFFLQRARLITSVKHIPAWIVACLVLWKKSAFEQLVTDCHSVAMSYLNRWCGCQNMEQRHRTLSNLFFAENCTKLYNLYSNGRQVEFYYLMSRIWINWYQLTKPSPQLSWDNIHTEKSCHHICWKCTLKLTRSFQSTSRRM